MPSPNSFTKTLVDELARSYRGAFSVAQLHSRILASLKIWKGDLIEDGQKRIWRDPINGRVREECYKPRTPVHCLLSNETPNRSIFLALLVRKSPDLEATSNASVDSPTTDSASDSEQTRTTTSFSSIDESRRAEVPQVLLSIRLEENYLSSVSSQQKIIELTEWLRNLPAGGKDIKIQGAYESFSTLMILSVPVSVWDVLLSNLAYSFIGFITSENKAPSFEPPSQKLPITNSKGLSNTTPPSRAGARHVTFQDDEGLLREQTPNEATKSSEVSYWDTPALHSSSGRSTAPSQTGLPDEYPMQKMDQRQISLEPSIPSQMPATNMAQETTQSSSLMNLDDDPSQRALQGMGASDTARGQQTEPQKITFKTGFSQAGAGKVFAFRCFHNAIAPEIFCVNQDTRERFRTCMGPGWRSMQYLK